MLVFTNYLQLLARISLKALPWSCEPDKKRVKNSAPVETVYPLMYFVRGDKRSKCMGGLQPHPYQKKMTTTEADTKEIQNAGERGEVSLMDP